MKTYKDIEYIIIKNPYIGTWLAYIKIPNNHSWKEIDCYDDVPLSVHCGLTFMSNVTKEKEELFTIQQFTIGKWIGWDYGHLCDYVNYGDYVSEGKKWTYEEVEEDVKHAIDDMLNLK